ncbi:hypothetical protein A3A79_02760 [Candidatus Gottesmanbacteria bacterium RIFCSPLOWO2_01_FULL_43_11b]|uniref:Uncharacterized protein n=1 Tax=Candidatus Gottesmanbacteria bacterium RIFCSPLOWO2_01_FULL_43_11b TaxID=1798392 RepID=A0A1F6AH93_9BACT|nr:MAG: hypothetical protein A3A79_02760 [Candidatus Gottesmanbacteria bacterium RIFCSPLOWO2_01_FULL_43_11b]
MIIALLAQLKNPVLPPELGAGDLEGGGRATGLLIGNLIGAIFIFSFILAFFYLLTGGISWITAGGDKGQLENARNKIIHALVGLIVVGAGWAIFSLVGQFLGIQFPNMELPTIE